MKDSHSISPSQARKLALLSQGIHKKRGLKRGKEGVCQAIEKIGYVQIDTISVIERAHHHVLNTRVIGYSAQQLHELQVEKRIFEYWSHAAAYLPMRDFRYSLPRKNALASGEKHWYQVDKKLKKSVLDRVRIDGPLQARDFEHVRRGDSGWWEWKPAKRALEQLFMEGALMITHRKGFQKVYDLSERVLPSTVDTSTPTEHEHHRHLISSYLGSHGIGTPAQFSYLLKGIKKNIERQCLEMCEEGLLVQLNVLQNNFYALPSFEQTIGQPLSRKAVEILSPFDNVVIQRQRLKEIFNYDYQIECYVPEEKRKYGYFVLPILWGQEFAGRMDAKIDRKTGIFQVKNLYIESPKETEFLQALEPALNEFREFNNGSKLTIDNTHKYKRTS